MIESKEMDTEEENIELLLGSTRSKMLRELTYSDLTFDDMSHLLSINRTAVKEHTDVLEKKGYVKSYFRKSGAGRPKKYFQLSERGMSLFPKKYSLLTGLLIDEVAEDLGQDYLNTILGRIAQKIVESVGASAPDDANITRDDRLRELKQFVGSLNKLGYYARLEITDDSVKIVRHNCIFYELAKVNDRIICGELEKNIIKSGVTTSFKMSEEFTNGGKSCVVEVKVPRE